MWEHVYQKEDLLCVCTSWGSGLGHTCLVPRMGHHNLAGPGSGAQPHGVAGVASCIFWAVPGAEPAVGGMALEPILDYKQCGP